MTQGRGWQLVRPACACRPDTRSGWASPLDSRSSRSVAALPRAFVAQWDPPALALAFHTAFIECEDGKVLRATGEVTLELATAVLYRACQAAGSPAGGLQRAERFWWRRQGLCLNMQRPVRRL